MRSAAKTALALLLTGAAALAAGAPPSSEGIRLDLAADWAPVLCGRELFLFSSDGRNQRMGPEDTAPECNLIQMSPAVQPVCGPQGTLVLAKDGTLWQLGENTETLLSGLKGGLAVFPLAGGPAVLFPDSLRFSDGTERRLPFPAVGGQALGSAGFWIRGEEKAARLNPDGSLRWTWKPAKGAPGPAALAGDRIAAGSSGGDLSVLRDVDGKALFTYRGGGPVTDPPEAAAGKIVFGSLDHFVRAVDLKTGVLAWQYRAEGRVSFGPVRVDAGLLFAESAGGRLFILSPDKGKKVWEWLLPAGNILRRPAVAGGKAVLLAWGEASTPTLYVVSLPPAPPKPAGGPKALRP